MGYPEPIDVIPHLAFPSTDVWLSAKEVGELRQQHGIAPDEPVIGCFCSIVLPNILDFSPIPIAFRD